MPPLLAIFLAGTLVWSALSLWLSRRQIRHVAARRERVPADFAALVSAEEHRRAADYTVARERLSMLRELAGTLLALGWAFGGIGLLWAALGGPALWRGVAFLLAMAVVERLVALPFRLWGTFAIEARFGFNRTTPALFARDLLKGSAISLLIGAPLLFAGLWVMRHAGGLWWLYAWAGLVVLMLVAPPVYVRLIAPRFNRFTPLADAGLRARLEALLARCGFRSDGLFTMDASRRSTRGNAYFIGFGRTKRIVLFDTLLERHPPEEIEAVVAHELGHFRRGHVLWGMLRGVAILFVVLAGIGWLARQPWLLAGFGLGAIPPAEAAAPALAVCMLLAGLLSPPMELLGNAISRRHEFEADAFAAGQAGAAPMVAALLRLARDNASSLTPDPLYALAHFSHPPVPLRIARLRAAGAPAGDCQETVAHAAARQG
jgi:STE24 endopeptidase